MFEQVEEWPDGDWLVRAVTGQAARKTYRCPGCDQQISPATPHLVAWPVGDVDSRRHWHRVCWRARIRRGVTTGRARRAGPAGRAGAAGPESLVT